MKIPLSVNRSKALAALLLILTFTGCAKKDVKELEKMSADGASESAVTASSVQPVKSEALLAMQCYNNAFYHEYGTYGSSFKAYYYSDVNHTGRMDFWKQAE